MSSTHSTPKKGKYAYSSHSLFVSGDIVDVFTGVWEQVGEGRALVKCEDGSDVVGGERMCVIKLRRPLSPADYREAHHADIRPLIKHMGSEVIAVLLPADMVCTIPDYMEVE